MGISIQFCMSTDSLKPLLENDLKNTTCFEHFKGTLPGFNGSHIGIGIEKFNLWKKGDNTQGCYDAKYLEIG